MTDWQDGREISKPQSDDATLQGGSNGRVYRVSPDRPVPAHNLRLQPTSLIGREHELRTIREDLLSDEIRLLTLTGPAGVGKTRLALAVAECVRSHFPHGVWLVELASVRDPDQVSSTIAQVLGLGEARYRAQAAVLQTNLVNRKALLILDNFEQVLPAATQIADLLATCPDVKIVATSRTRLRLRWEHVRQIHPLSCERASSRLTIEEIAELPAVALFVRRARASRPSFALTTENVEAVVTLCADLDGLPLAIELAAARANALTPNELIEWIERSRPGLGWDAQDLPPRHQTLRAALEWSYALLTPAEQALLRRLSAFVDGWTLEAAATITRVQTLGLDPQVGLASLVDASLLNASANGQGESRYTMLDVTHEVASDLLAASGEGDETRSLHADYFAMLADRARRGLEGGGRQCEWFTCLELDHENLRAALGWAARLDDRALQLRVASDLAYFWWANDYLHEGREWLADALASSPDAPAAARARGLEAIGLLTAYLGELQSATDHLEEAAALARQLGDGHSAIGAVGALVRVASLQARPERHATLAVAIDAARPSADPWSLSFALQGLGSLAYEAENLAAARTHLEEAVGICRRMEDQFGLANALGTLTLVEHDSGDRGRAVALAREALELARQLGSLRTIARCTHVVVFISGASAPAAVLSRLLGAAESLRSTANFRLSPLHQSLVDEIVDATREQLGEQTFAEAWIEGRTMPLDDLVVTGLAALEATPNAQRPAPASRADQPTHGVLSPREYEVLQHVAEGLTNRQIADRLIISVATVNYHVTSVLYKLGADNRTQAVMLASQRGLISDITGPT
jgi:predicted ATPase/DNA-binding NarL/FixJ family response regulator